MIRGNTTRIGGSVLGSGRSSPILLPNGTTIIRDAMGIACSTSNSALSQKPLLDQDARKTWRKWQSSSEGMVSHSPLSGSITKGCIGKPMRSRVSMGMQTMGYCDILMTPFLTRQAVVVSNHAGADHDALDWRDAMATEQPTTIPVPKSNKVFICQYCSQPFTRPRPQKYCSHVCRARANVDQLAKNLPPPKDPEQRFWDTVIKTDECWEWQGKKFPNNYGCFFVTEDGKKRWKLAHRVAWKLRDGTLEYELLILHTCDNPICVRNDDQGWYEVNGVLRRRYGHLFEGTTQDNIDDKVYKQRKG